MTAPHSISSGTAELAAKLAEIPLDQSHFGWPTIAPVRLSETERDLIVAALRTPALPSGAGEVEAVRQKMTRLKETECRHSGQLSEALLYGLHRAVEKYLMAIASSPAPQGVAQPPTTRELHDAIASAISNGRTYSGIQDAVRAIQKLYASPQIVGDATNAQPITTEQLDKLQFGRALHHQRPTPPFSRWADTIEAASLTISPKGSKELDALAAEVRAGGVAQRSSEPFRTTAERIVKTEQDKCHSALHGCIRNIREGDRGQAAGSLVDAISDALEDAVFGGAAQPPRQPTEAMLDAARDWSREKYGKPIGNDAATGCWLAMHGAATLSSTPQKTLGRTDREGGWNAERGLSVTSTTRGDEA